MQAEALDECLREGRGELRGLPRRFFRRAAKAIDVPWMLAAGEDFRYPEVEGHKPLGTDFVNWYVGKVHRAATRDPEVCRAFFKVMVLTHPPTILFDPRIAWRILRSGWTARRAPRKQNTGPCWSSIRGPFRHNFACPISRLHPAHATRPCSMRLRP